MICLILLTQWVIPITSLAASKTIVFNNISTIRKVTKNLAVAEINTKDLDLCNQQVDNLKSQNSLLRTERQGLIQDKADLSNTMGEYKDKYTSVAAKLNACEQAKPSRMTWFGVGFATALVALLSLFVAK